MQMIAWMLDQPALDRRRLVRAVVIEDEVDVEVRGDLRIDRIQKLAEFPGAMSLLAAGDHCARRAIERGDERGRTVARVVMRVTLRLTGPEGQHRRGAIERLHLGFLVDAQHERALRWREIEPHHVPHLR